MKNNSDCEGSLLVERLKLLVKTLELWLIILHAL